MIVNFLDDLPDNPEHLEPWVDTKAHISLEGKYYFKGNIEAMKPYINKILVLSII